MTVTTLIVLFLTMVVLAVVPGPGVFTVIARSMTAGYMHGIMTTIGIVTADFIFILCAIFGLSAAAEMLGDFFRIVSYLGGVYLIWLGYSLLTTKVTVFHSNSIAKPSWYENYLAGLFVTLSNPKAILFYAGFFPAFLDLSALTFVDVVKIMGVTALAVGGTMLVYAYLASQVKTLFQTKQTGKRINTVAGAIMVLTGVFLLVKA